MDEGYVVLVNLAPSGKSSDSNPASKLSGRDAELIGSLVVNDLFQKAQQRPEGSRPFYLYIDECARYVNGNIARILDESRKRGLHLVLAHQHLSQLHCILTNMYHSFLSGRANPKNAYKSGNFGPTYSISTM